MANHSYNPGPPRQQEMYIGTGTRAVSKEIANKIAGQFNPGFFDGRMVEDITRLIAEHLTKNKGRID